MEAGRTYDLDPPANIKGKRFRRVTCRFQVPQNKNEFVVRGVPEGGSEEEDFLLIFKPDKGVRVTPVPDENDDPYLKLVK